MNILVTLPKKLIDKIISGDKKMEMRKCLPKKLDIGIDGFFVVEKGTDVIRCWCRVDDVLITNIDDHSAEWLAFPLGVSASYIENYADGKEVYLWKIGKVVKFENLCRSLLLVDRNPQQFAYCPLSYGQSY